MTQNRLNGLCNEFKKHFDLIFIGDEVLDGSKNKNKVRLQKNKERNKFMGVKKAEPNRKQKMNSFEKHYFILCQELAFNK